MLRGEEEALRGRGEGERSSPTPPLPLLFWGSRGGSGPGGSRPKPRLSRPPMASSRLCSSRDPSPRVREDRLVCSPPGRTPRGELWVRGWKGDLKEAGRVRSVHAGGGVELRTTEVKAAGHIKHS